MSEELANRMLAERVYYQLSLIFQQVNSYDHNILEEKEIIEITSLSKRVLKDIVKLLKEYEKKKTIVEATKEKKFIKKLRYKNKETTVTKKVPAKPEVVRTAANKKFIKEVFKSTVDNLILFNSGVEGRAYKTQGGILKALSELVIIPFIKTLMKYNQKTVVTKTATLIHK